MTIEDIDTPVDEALLSGEAEAEKELPADPPAADEPAATKADAPAVEPEKVDEPAAPAVDAGRDKQIPRARFDEVNSKLHEEREARERAEAELAALKAAPAPDINAMEKEYSAALMGGEEDKAAEIRANINAELIRQATEAAFAKTDKLVTQLEQKRTFNDAVNKTIKDYPFLDSETGNQEAIAEVVEWRDFYISKGHPPHEALTKAAARVAPAYVETPADPANVVQIDPRKAAAIARGARDSRAQPAAPVAGVGNRAVPVKPDPETQEEWEKTPQAERDKLLA